MWETCLGATEDGSRNCIGCQGKVPARRVLEKMGFVWPCCGFHLEGMGWGRCTEKNGNNWPLLAITLFSVALPTPKQPRSRTSRLLLEIWLWLEEEGPVDGRRDRGVFIQEKSSDVDSRGTCQLLPEELS